MMILWRGAACSLLGCLLLSAQAQTLDWTLSDSARLSSRLESGEYGRVTSAWIEQGGKVLFEEYFHGADADTLHNTRSAGKSVTGLLVGMAIEDGFLDGTRQRAAAFFPELQPFENGDPRKQAITLEDLLTMSGPLECDDWNSFSRGNEERMYLVEDWSAFFWNLPIKNRPSWELPEDTGGFDRLFAYCTAGVQLLGEIVERAAGEPVPDYSARRLFEPLGIEPVKWNLAATGKAHLGGGFELTTAGWARIGRLYVERGRADGEQIVSSDWIDRSLSDYVKIDDKTNYGFLWWRPRFEKSGWTVVANTMSGAGGNRVWVLPEFDLVVVLTKDDFRDRDAHAKSDRFFTEDILNRLPHDAMR